MIDINSLIENEDLSTETGVNRVRDKLLEREDAVNQKLMGILAKQCHIETKMNGINRALNNLSIIGKDSQQISLNINHTAVLAETVSAKVRRLDEARNRVSELQQRVHDLIDLQLCAQGVTTAIRDEDFEKGAGHIHRFLSMDQNLLQRTADDVSGSITSVSQAVSTLEQATVQMRQLTIEKFDEAVKKDDLASVERFFKIFPLLGMYDDGIDKFSAYICMKLQLKSQKELRSSMDVAKAEKRTAVAFADTLTLIFENLARVIEVNQPIIENYYGNGRIIQMFKILQKECDYEIKKLIQEFHKYRHIQRYTTQINDNVRSVNSTGGGGGGGTSTGGTSGGNSSLPSGNQQSSVLGHFRKASGGSGGSTDKLNPKDIDRLIDELTIMHSSAELYIKFMRRRITNDLENTNDNSDVKQKKLKLFEEILMKSDLSRQMQELLGSYLLFERYFMEESVLKAIALDTFDQGQQCSSMVDDVFFITRKSLRRSISTQSLDGICAVINNAASCLESDFIAALKIPLKNGYPSGYIDLAQAYNVFQTTIQQGKLQTGSDTEQARTNFIVQLNNADMSTEYIETLCTTMNDEILFSLPNLTGREREMLDSCLTGLKSVRNTLKAVVDFGMQQLRSSAIKPRLHTWVDQFITQNHEFTEEELANYEAGETFVQSLIIQLDTLLNSFKLILSSRNYNALVSILATDVSARLERAIKKCTFNRFGGLVLDQEVRTLGSYLTSATSWSVRDKMVRLTQIATLLNLEKLAELSDYWNPMEQREIPAWRLTPTEVRSLLALRIDFKMDEIKRLKI